jgi:hypothetical protein
MGTTSRQPQTEGRHMEQEMASPTQNQARMGPPVNVLSEQNRPNTLGGIGPPALVAVRFPVGALAVAAILVLAAAAAALLIR